MPLPSIVSATGQSAVIGALSNILAQAITAHRNDIPLVIDWVPVFQFFVFACLCTPPNFLWQEFLEQTFPAYHAAPTEEAIASAAAGDDKALDRSAAEGHLVEPRLNAGNTAAKMALDQTVGAAANTLMFSVFMNAAAAATAHSNRGPSSLAFLVSGGAFDYGRVNWRAVAGKTRESFWGLMVAGWTFWPLVSLFNFTLVRGVEARNLVGSLAGVAWGVYMSLFTAR